MPDSVDNPAPLKITASPEATRSASIPNDPGVLVSASWVTTPWCLMSCGSRSVPRLGYDLGRGGGYRPDHRGRARPAEQDRVVIRIGHQPRPELRDAFLPFRDVFRGIQPRRRAVKACGGG